MSNTQLFNSPPASSAIVQIESSRAVQEVQAALVIAKKFPRDQKQAMDRILNACTRPSLANVAVYQYSRGGTDITGPSIRLAEAIAQQWGNLTFGFTELEQSGGASSVEAFCWDLETNTKRSVTFQVPHVRYSKGKGNTELSDPRDIYELVANSASRRVRSCILATIPGDVVDAAREQCEETMSADADTSPDAQKKILASFDKFGVTKDQIEKRIQRRLDAIQPAQVVSLRKIHASLKDGMSQPSEWFETIIPAANVGKTVEAETSAPTPQQKRVAKVAAEVRTVAKQPKEEMFDVAPVPLIVQIGDAFAQAGVEQADALRFMLDNGALDDARTSLSECTDEEIARIFADLSAIIKGVKEGAN